jgi:hypothetical protein
MHGTLPAKIRRYKVDGQDCILASVAAVLLGVHRKTITRRQQKPGGYRRLVDAETGRVMVPLSDLTAALPALSESEFEDA